MRLHKTLLFLAVLAVGPNARSQAPWATTQSPGPVGRTAATLSGMATPRGYSTTAWFEWGADTTYGLATTPTNIGTGKKVIRMSAPLDGLAPGAVYHYRIVATNALGSAVGADKVFITGTKVATWCDHTTRDFPLMPTGLTNIVAQACGHGHSLALTSDGSVVAWMDSGYLNPGYYGEAAVPDGLTNVIAVAGGYSHSLALRQDGTVAAWGSYFYSSPPIIVPANVTNVVAIAGGDADSVALKGDGSVVAWNSYGNEWVPYGLSNVVAIAEGSSLVLALRADGTVFEWGRSGFDGPPPPAWLTNVVAISSEGWHSLALRSDGTVVSWGNNSYGQTNVPAGLSNVIAVSAGFRHSVAVKADGTLTAWGLASYVTNVPAALSNVVAISSGDYHSLALGPMNLPPTPGSRGYYGPLNSDMTIALKGSDSNGDPLTFRITYPPATGSLYQFTATGRGDLITASNTPVSDSFRVIFSPPADSSGVPLASFGFIANDGEYDSVDGVANLMIVPPPLIQPGIFASGATQGYAFDFTGLSNAPYFVQASTNLVNWRYLGLPTQPTAGQFHFFDTGVTNNPCRFYRISLP